jgi:flavin reductase (DIM6/NTAB) family NADH-FMN oxidoreductase RutF
MRFDPSDTPRAEFYRLMISVIVPRPIAFVSSLARDGRTNLAPFSFFSGITSQPPLIGISILQRKNSPKDTLLNIRETGDFVVNVADEALGERMVRASGDWPAEVSEFEVTGLTPVASERVKSPRVAESPVSLECRLFQEVALGDSAFVVGEILLAHVADDRFTDGRVDVRKLKPLARLGGEEYARLGEVLRMPRPIVNRTTGGS